MNQKNSIAWSLDNHKRISIINPEYQGPSLYGENIVDLTVSSSNHVYALDTDGESSRIIYSLGTFPPQWNDFQLDFPLHSHPRRIDCSDSKLYMLLTTGEIVSLDLKDGKLEENSKPTVLEGIDMAMQISAAGDGKVWIVAATKEGSEVLCYDGKSWDTIPDVKNALKVTGTNDGKAYVINTAGEILLYDISGKSSKIKMDFSPKQISVGIDGRLWALADAFDENGFYVYYTDNDGKDWKQVDGARAIMIDAGALALEKEVASYVLPHE